VSEYLDFAIEAATFAAVTPLSNWRLPPSGIVKVIIGPPAHSCQHSQVSDIE
jgi:hypothetical protein